VPSRQRIAAGLALAGAGQVIEEVPGVHDELEIGVTVDTV
jgi:hypothetical protein